MTNITTHIRRSYSTSSADPENTEEGSHPHNLKGSSADQENTEGSMPNLVHEPVEVSKAIGGLCGAITFSSVFGKAFLASKEINNNSDVKIESSNSKVRKKKKNYLRSRFNKRIARWSLTMLGSSTDFQVEKSFDERSSGIIRSSDWNPDTSSNDQYNELVAAGWPSWLVAYGGFAIVGWTPRWDHTFEILAKWDDTSGILRKTWQGTDSEVYRARDLWVDKIVVLKKVRFVIEPECVEFMAQEILNLRQLNSPNGVKLEGLVMISDSSYSLYLVFEYKENDLAASAPGKMLKKSSKVALKNNAVGSQPFKITT